MLNRRGSATAELAVVMTMLGIVGAAAAGALAQQGRVRMRIAGRAAAEVQMREALAPLIADLGAASPAGGDFRAGQARDTALEFRAPAGVAYVCASEPAPSTAVYAAVLMMERGRAVAAGDTAWAYVRRKWRGVGVDGVEPAVAPVPGCTEERVVRITLTADSAPAAGTPLRFTRRVRYNLYRASDGKTYLGLREWAASTGMLSGVQPIAGPFDRVHSRFLYFDTLGAELASGVAAGTELGSVTVELRGSNPVAFALAGGGAAPASITIGLRNRP